MERVYETYAYTDAPRSACYWNETPTLPPNPVAQGTLDADIVIIGGGYTGLSAALHLAEAGEGVMVLEAEHMGWGASGRSGGFCCLGGGKISNAALTRRFGDAGRQSYRAAEKESVALVDGLITRHGWDVARQSRGETILAHRPRAWAGMIASVDAVTSDYGVAPELIPKEALRQHGMAGPFHGAMTVPIGFGLNPRAYVQGLAQAAGEAGARLCDGSPVTAVNQTGRGFVLTTSKARITARRVIFATNGYTAEDVPGWLRARFLPLQSNILVTRALSADEQAAQGWTTDQMAYDSRTLLHYFRLLPDGRFLFGMRGGVYANARSTARLRKEILRDFHAMFPAWAHVEVPYLWSGLVCLARNLTPFVGPIPEMPGAFAGLAYHGNGIAMGSYAGRLLADLVRDRMPEAVYPEALQQVPGRFPFGQRRRALLAGINALTSVRDRF